MLIDLLEPSSCEGNRESRFVPVRRKNSIQTQILAVETWRRDRCTIPEQGTIPWLDCGPNPPGRFAIDMLRLISFALQSHTQLAAENLFLRKPLALYVERQVKARRADDPTRITLVALSSLIEWRRTLTIVKPDRLIGWHRKTFRLFWHRKSKPRGRPR